MGAHVEERATYCPRCGEPATRIVRGPPDPEYLQDLERANVDYELGDLIAFEESSEWWCRSCGYEWREDEPNLLE
jgi:Zn finger protein HypA/HybF involved in hydrogenase expression